MSSRSRKCTSEEQLSNCSEEAAKELNMNPTVTISLVVCMPLSSTGMQQPVTGKRCKHDRIIQNLRVSMLITELETCCPELTL